MSGLLTKWRLVTVVGPAGAGKTRLSIEVAGRVGDRLPGGAWWVDLAAVGSAELVAPAVAEVMDAQPRAGQSALEAICAAVRNRRLLLVVDNCEHLLEAAGRLVAAVLARCPGVRVLATSREELWLRGEQVYRIAGLGLPEPLPGMSAADALAVPAVRLFADRAATADPTFALTDEAAWAVVQLCRRLDGLPLAIELAARRVRLFGVVDMLARLEGGLGLLTTGGALAAGRHGSLRAAIEWSYRLLDLREQAVLRGVSVTAGPFSLDLATQMCMTADLTGEQVLDALVGLEAKSLLVSVPGGEGGTARLRLLESIRLFGRERLAEAGEVDAVHDRLTAALVARTERYAGTYLNFFDYQQEFAGDWSSVLAAAEWAAGRADQRYAPLATALSIYLSDCGLLDQARNVLTGALECCETTSDHRGVLLLALARESTMRGDHAECRRWAEEAVTFERQKDGPTRLAPALSWLARAAHLLGDAAGALAALEESLGLSRRAGDRVGTAALLNALAWTALQANDLGLAGSAAVEGLELTREADSGSAGRRFIDVVRADLLHTAGLLALELHQWESAEARFAESMRMCPTSPHHVAHALDGLAIIAVRRGRNDVALRLAGCADRVRRDAGYPAESGWRERVDAAMTETTGRVGNRRATAARSSGARIPLADAVAWALGQIDPAGSPLVTRRPQVPADPSSVVDLPGPDRPTRPRLRPSMPLSEREYRIAELVTEGLTNAQIARRLNVSARTVAAHLEQARVKLGVDNRAELAARIARGVS